MRVVRMMNVFTLLPPNFLRARAKLPPVSLTKLIERERYKPPPAPVHVMAVSGREEETGRSGVKGESSSEKTEKNSAVPDYFADEIDV